MVPGHPEASRVMKTPRCRPVAGDKNPPSPDAGRYVANRAAKRVVKRVVKLMQFGQRANG
ncbi:hypothetical protein EOS_01880 [Caballeronia mineralivorans PML1(12)]|uniref:Uncharacterized protein n=1 Tax=Caballeronia mineralivorans PML1(12) TaxID=908627 RepID=A0A0J1D5H3_9BURK|nr:hypothetical protein EOS_01880 [Caballeronia mineralivorans PML1(12)]